MGIIKNLKNDNYHLRTTEEVDLLFGELEALKRPIDDTLDYRIRMAILKLKIQLYYEAKLRVYRQKFPNVTSGKSVPSSKNTTNNNANKEKKHKSETNNKKKRKQQPIVNKPQPRSRVLFWTFKEVDSIVDYFMENREEFDTLTDNWIRQNMSGQDLLDYYIDKLNDKFGNEQSDGFLATAKDLEEKEDNRNERLDTFRSKILDYIDKKKINIQKPPTPRSKKARVSPPKKKINFEILQKKEWILDWNCVLFKRGYVVIYSRSDMGLKFKPTKVYAEKSIESFNYLKKYLNERLPPIRCTIVGKNLTVDDEINFNEAILQFESAARQSAIKSGGSYSKASPRPMSFSQALSKAQKMTPEDFKKYKSEFIDFLVTQQSKNYKVIPCVERLAHSNSDTTEYAFMFTIECKFGDILIVHENVNPDRSTLLFIVKRDSYDKCIRSIYDFLQSPEINKRSSLRDKDIDIKQDGILRYRSINHDILYTWEKTISNYKLHYHNDYIFYF